MKVTIKDISSMTGASCSTISRVLSHNGYVKKETRNLIEKALIESGYRYNPTHDKQSKGLKDLVLVICGDISSQVYVGYLRGITQKLESANYKTVCFDSRYSTSQEEDYLQYAIVNGFAGVIMLSVIQTDRIVELVKSMDCPIVLINRHLRAVETDAILIDNYFGGYLATKHLIEKGHTRIAHLGGPENSSTCRDRMSGYVDAMKDAKLEIQDDDIFFGDLQYGTGYSFGLHLAEKKKDITAVFSANDIMAAALIDALYDRGISVPEKISVDCMDNTQAASSSRTKLTTVSYDSESMGIAAAEILLERIENPMSKKRKNVYAPSLIERNSVRPL